MGKNGELWDDSALIKAFDHAISKYKKMHVNPGTIDTVENLPAAEADIETTEYMQNDDNILYNLEAPANIEETAEILQSKEESPLELHSPAYCVGVSNIENHNVPPTNDIPSNKSVTTAEHTVPAQLKDQAEATCYSDGPQEYSELLNKYYDIESQRRHILHQLNQYSNWNYQYPFSGTSTADVYQTSEPQPYEAVVCHCPYGCQSWVVPCDSSGAACSGGNQIDATCHAKDSQNGNSGSRKDPNFVNTAMAAAEKALALTKQVNRGACKQLDVERGQFPESSSATDLDVVLNAWYTAGFYTGKFLSEQSMDGRKQGEGSA